MTPLILAALLSMSPVGELRVGIPVALASGVNPWLALVVCVFANFLVAPIVFAILELFHTKFLHVNSHQSSLDKFMERSRVKVNPWIEKYGVFGLALFSAIPIPGTGAYTGTIAAWFLGMNKLKVMGSIFVGVSVSGLLVLGATSGIMKLFGA